MGINMLLVVLWLPKMIMLFAKDTARVLLSDFSTVWEVHTSRKYMNHVITNLQQADEVAMCAMDS